MSALGLSLADWAINRCLLDFGLAIAVHLVWLCAWAIAATVHGEAITPIAIGAFAFSLFAIHLMTTSLLFFIGATGSPRGAELYVMLVFFALTEPVLTRAMPRVAAILMRGILPPVLPVLNVRSQLSTGDSLSAVLPSILHIGAYALILLGTGTWLLSRRKPEESSSPE